MTTAPDPSREHRGYPGLNALRAAGALMVLTTHTAFDTGQVPRGWTGAVLARMDFGVALFFVLSGFLLGRPFLLRGARGLPAPALTVVLLEAGPSDPSARTGSSCSRP